MPLPIQPDESLPSFVRRNLLLHWAEPQEEIFESLTTRHVIKTAEVRRLAAPFFVLKRSLMHSMQAGWPSKSSA